ncbi:AEC family transporter [Candidatus Pelagibacter bacterium]|nr:AEC family transporter [Candidatus Pelagibacter bacterium]MDC0352648.1 AEC family transporter [Candidatus Pelagibacter sp.]
MDIYLKLFEVLFPVFFIIGIGYYLGKKNPKLDTTFIANFAANIGSPAMVFYAVTTTGISFNIFAEYFWYSLIAILGFAITGIIFLKFLNKDIVTELPPFILPNTGNMGLPLCLFAYGTQGLGIAATISSLVILFHFTIGVFLASKKLDLNLLFKSPPFYAIIISVLFLYYEIEVPVFLINTTMMLTYAAIFLILMSLGIALTRFKVFSFRSALISSIARVIIGPLIGFAIIKIFNLTGFAAGVLLIQCSMPSAVLTYLVGSLYSSKKVVDSIASMIVVSTVMSFITVPITVFIALKYFY